MRLIKGTTGRTFLSMKRASLSSGLGAGVVMEVVHEIDRMGQVTQRSTRALINLIGKAL